MAERAPNSDPAPVLRDLVNNEVKDNPEDDDLALAKALQEQERAFLLLANSGRLGGGSHSENAFFQRLGSGGQAGSSHSLASQSREGSEAGSSGLEGPAEDGDEDAALARRLQQEEEREHYAHMMQLAGFGGEEDDEDDDEEGYLSDDSLDPDNMTYEELQRLGETVGTVSRGVSADVAASLPLAKFGACSATQRATPDEECAVCRMEFEGGESVKLLPCSHFYHPGCIDQWLAINKVCPICHAEVSKPAASEHAPCPASQQQQKQAAADAPASQ